MTLTVATRRAPVFSSSHPIYVQTSNLSPDAATQSTGGVSPTTQIGVSSNTQLIAVFLCGMFAFLELYCVQPLLPLLARAFHASETHVGLTISASTLGVAISSALLALFGESLNRKRTIVLSMAALGVCTMLTATANGLDTLAFWRLLQGLITPGIFILTIAYVTEEWTALQVPRAMSTYMAGTIFGAFLGRSVGGLLAGQGDWHAVFLVLGAASFLGAPLVHRLLPQSRERAAKPAAANAAAANPAIPQPASVLAPVLANLRNPRLLATFGIGFCLMFTLVSVFSFITFDLTAAPFHLSAASISGLFAVYLVGVFTTLAAGTSLARIGLRRGMLASITLCFAGVCLTLIPSLTLIAIGLAVVSSGIFIAQTCANSFLRDAAPLGARVSAAGMYICSYYIGGTAGGELPGIAWRHAGWPGCVGLTCALLVIAGLTALWGWPAHRSQPDPIPL